MKRTRKGQVIPPDKIEDHSVKLDTLGAVRTEMSHVYNQQRMGHISPESMSKKIWSLKQIGDVIVDATRLNIDQRDEGADRPVFTGLQITAPPEQPATLKMIEGGKTNGKAAISDNDD